MSALGPEHLIFRMRPRRAISAVVECMRIVEDKVAPSDTPEREALLQAREQYLRCLDEADISRTRRRSAGSAD